MFFSPRHSVSAACVPLRAPKSNSRHFALEWTAAQTLSHGKARALFDRFADLGTRQVPTLAMHYQLDHAREFDRNDPRRRYLPASVLAAHDYVLEQLYLKGRTPRLDAEWAALFDHRLAMVGHMYRAGVPIMTGTDTGTCGVYPGFGVHDELRLLVQAGIPPMAALAAATAEPARFLGVADRAGTLSRGKIADLVILAANPLDDITNTQKIDGIVVRGRYIGPAERTEILRAVEKAATMPTITHAAASCPCHTPA